MQLLRKYLPKDVTIDERVLCVNGNAVGLIVPSSIFYETSHEFKIFGPKGYVATNKSDINIWRAMLSSDSILLGVNNEPYILNSLLKDLQYSKILSYLSGIAQDCSQLYKAYKYLQEKTVAIVGLGGIGSMATISLAGSGVRKIKIIDADVVEKSNLNRQFLYSERDIGKHKADILCERILERYPNCEIQLEKKFINERNADDLLKDQNFVLVTADEPLNVPKLVFAAVQGKADALSCGYINSMASFHYVSKGERSDKHFDASSILELDESRIIPSIAPINLELAGLASLRIILSLTELSESHNVVKGIWNTVDFPRSWNTSC